MIIYKLTKSSHKSFYEGCEKWVRFGVNGIGHNTRCQGGVSKEKAN